MAKDKENKSQETQENVMDVIREGNQITDSAIESAVAEITKEKDEAKKDEAKKALCIATFVNRKKVLETRHDRRKADLRKEDLTKSKELLEKLLGVECDIKDGACVPTKKKIDPKLRLTPTEFEEENKKRDEEYDKKLREAEKTFAKELSELRNSYEGRYRHYVESYWY